ncbi:MAG TPA: hypothetical protein VLA12_04630, partial [Planctomycetaceae bacterium]|nr:hypothetical protein [Planctomycetaceae bacterium]
MPLLQMNFRVLREKPLVGVENKTKRLRVSFNNWWNGTMAESIEVRMSRHMGFRPTLIRVANQFRVALGSEPSKLENSRVTVCEDNWLLADNYMADYTSPTQVLSDSEVSEFVGELKELQERLRAEGKAMLFVISPSKAETYPEYLPEWALKERQAYEGESDLERLRRHLAGSGVVVFDTPKYFQQQKNASPQKFFTKTGIHWNYYTAFHVWRELLQLVNREYGKNLPMPEQIGVEYDGPRGTDDDIAKLLNVFYLPGVEDPVAYPVVRTDPLPESARPDFLFAGTSFSRTLVDTLYLTESGRNCDYLFYTSRYLTHRIPEEK